MQSVKKQIEMYEKRMDVLIALNTKCGKLFGAGIFSGGERSDIDYLIQSEVNRLQKEIDNIKPRV